MLQHSASRESIRHLSLTEVFPFITGMELEDIKAVKGMLEMLLKQFPASTSLTIDSLRQLVESVNLKNRSQTVTGSNIKKLYGISRIIFSVPS